MITGRKHILSWLFKLGGQLDKQYEEIVKALSDINVFNVGKKRDKALTLLSAWLPEVRGFQERSGNRERLYPTASKKEMDQSGGLCRAVQEAKYEEEQKRYEKASQRIF